MPTQELARRSVRLGVFFTQKLRRQQKRLTVHWTGLLGGALQCTEVTFHIASRETLDPAPIPHPPHTPPGGGVEYRFNTE
jgi:hypothetical protein